MPDLLIRIKKKTDGGAALSCTRADGSVTWQRQDGQLGAHFPLHDLTHYAVENTLGFRQGFFGLLAEGWDISDFGGPGNSTRVPEEGHLAEVIVGFFDLERMMRSQIDVDDCNEKILNYFSDRDRPEPRFRLTEADATRIREARANAFARWRDVPPGETLELPFERGEQRADTRAADAVPAASGDQAVSAAARRRQ